MNLNSQQELHNHSRTSYELVQPNENHQELTQHLHLPETLKISLGDGSESGNVMESHNSLMGTHTIEIHLDSSHLVESLGEVSLANNQGNSSGTSNPQMLYLLKSITEEDNTNDSNLETGHEIINNGTTVVVVTTLQNGTPELNTSHLKTKETDSNEVIKILQTENPIKSEPIQSSAEQRQSRPKRKAALNNKYITDNNPKVIVTHPIRTTVVKEPVKETQPDPKPTAEVDEDEVEDIQEEQEAEEVVSDTTDDENTDMKQCVICLRQRKFTEDIFDSSKKLYAHIDVLVAYLNIEVKGEGSSSGICPECMNHLQRWHVFSSAIVRRHSITKNSGEKFVKEPITYELFESRVYRNHKKMGRVKEVFLAATHAHYARRNITDKDWDFFCDHLFHSNSVKSEKSRELERFITSREKMSHMYCMKCKKMISNGKKGFTRHMKSEHKECPVMYPCDICGITFPEKDMTASTEDYYPHWISHFYFNECNDCGKRFPTKRALGQHRHAVHKNRQVKCDKCGKVLANKMSLDLHLLRHLPENEKKKYLIKCKICKRKIAQWNIKSHMATHNDERPWKCDHCEATFKMKGALVSHRDVVHFNLKNHVCTICGEAFKSASSLRGHVRRHEGRKDYKCEICFKEYYTYSALKGHKIVHQTVRNFICDICSKAFKKKKALEEHVTIHTGVKPHQCPICGREIRVKSNLYKHMKIHKKSMHDSSTGNARRKNNTENNPNETPTGSIASNSILLAKNSNDTATANPKDRPASSANDNITSSAILGNKDPTFLSTAVEDHITPQTQILPDIGFANSNFQESTTRVHTLALQHQDLLNVQGSLFYSHNQYFVTDSVQN